MVSKVEVEIGDPVAAARSARLRYRLDDEPGITRERKGKGFHYLTPDGKTLNDEDDLERIRALGIPPAWTEVWISPHANAHLQATGRDAKGRKQYRYHERWRERRNLVKFSRMIAFAEVLPALRQRLEKDLKQSGLPREKVLAAVVQLLDTTHIRIGSSEYARSNESFGLSTLRDKHVHIEGTTMRFSFRGKSGKDHDVDLKDRRLARIVQMCKDVPGKALFQYIDEDGGHHPITAGDVNAYLREITGQDFTAKDFRTWGGTLLAIRAFQACEPCETMTQLKRSVSSVIKQVAEQLGNTPTVCRKYYVHPLVIEAYLDGTLADALEKVAAKKRSNGAASDEKLVIAILEQLENA